MPRCWPPTTARSSSWPRQGAEIVDVTLPARFADLGGIVGRIISAEIYAAISDLADDNATPLDQDVRPRVRAGAAISSKDYLAGLAERERMKLDFNAAIEGVDALLTPTMVTPAPVVASIDQNTTPAVFTRWVNFYDLCAAAVPNGFTAGGLPTSLQIVCRAYRGAVGAADRLCLSGRARLAPAGAADGGGAEHGAGTPAHAEA